MPPTDHMGPSCFLKLIGRHVPNSEKIRDFPLAKPIQSGAGRDVPACDDVSTFQLPIVPFPTWRREEATQRAGIVAEKLIKYRDFSRRIYNPLEGITRIQAKFR